MIGIDIVEIDRLINQEKALANYLLSDLELALYHTKSGQTALQFLAGRFAAKEALVKALNHRQLIFKEISILNDSSGRPYVMGHDEIDLSIAHEKHYAVAIVIVKNE